MDTENTSDSKKPSISKETLDIKVYGQSVDKYNMTNSDGLQVEVLSYGGIITRILTPDRQGKMDDIVIGFNDYQKYLEEHPYFGAIVGRYGNRIAKGQFTINGQSYSLATNNGPNHLHGGVKGFDKKIWDVDVQSEVDRSVLKLKYTGKDGEEGYPGKLECTVTYTLHDNGSFTIDYKATADAPTHVNLTQHTYFNLGGIKSQSILEHIVMLNADRYVPVDENLIPLGEIESVNSSPFDFTSNKLIGKDINGEHVQISRGGGYDHCWVLNKESEQSLSLAARVSEPSSGRTLEVYTTEPGVQFYTGNFLDGSLTGKRGKLNKRAGFCLETQHYPDTPNQSHFPSTLLKPGEHYESTTVFLFGITEK